MTINKKYKERLRHKLDIYDDIIHGRLSIKFPEFNLKEKDKEIYNIHKGTIISNIIIKKYRDFNPTFTVVGDELFIEFDMHKYPEYDVIRSFFFFDIKKKDVLDEMKNYKPKIESVPKI